VRADLVAWTALTEKPLRRVSSLCVPIEVITADTPDATDITPPRHSAAY
jgi:hypothetical protein